MVDRYVTRKGIESGPITDYDRRYSSLLMKLGGTTIIPVESVYAVLESKQVIDLEQVRYAGEKAASVRRLVARTQSIRHVGGVSPPRPVKKTYEHAVPSAP